MVDTATTTITTDARAWVYYRLTFETSAQLSLKYRANDLEFQLKRSK